jgi:hypothetical protein
MIFGFLMFRFFNFKLFLVVFDSLLNILEKVVREKMESF